MNYYLDTEFVEDGKTIDLLSIGIVCEDGRELYLLNRDCNLRRAMKHDWVRDNVLLPMYCARVHGDMRNHTMFDRYTMRWIFNESGLNKKSIATSVLDFMGFLTEWGEVRAPEDRPVIWAYFADYDWVAFCQLFGRMVDLPKGMPYFCMDLKQSMKERGLTKEWKQESCPDPANEHNALADARWNKQLHEAIYKTVPA